MTPRILAMAPLVGLSLLASFGCRERERRGEAAEGPRYGALMSEVGRRFELLGRASAAHRWELAAFELHELEEVFEELPRARQPGRVGDVNLRGLEQAFTNTHPPELRAALTARDAPAFAAAFGRAAATCNACHKATTHAFIEIPSEPGARVPRLDPLP